MLRAGIISELIACTNTIDRLICQVVRVFDFGFNIQQFHNYKSGLDLEWD